MEDNDDVLTLMTVHEIANRLGVKAPVVYYWLEQSEDPEWAHPPFPRPLAQLKRGKKQGESTPVWFESQMETIKSWREVHDANKRKR